eukprot:jgi/Ulvmu1/10660/UM066_0041.1
MSMYESLRCATASTDGPRTSAGSSPRRLRDRVLAVHNASRCSSIPSTPLTPHSSTCSGGRITTFRAPPARALSAADSFSSSAASTPRSLFDAISHATARRNSRRNASARQHRRSFSCSRTPRHMQRMHDSNADSGSGSAAFAVAFASHRSERGSASTAAAQHATRWDVPAVGWDDHAAPPPATTDSTFKCYLSIHNCQVSLRPGPAAPGTPAAPGAPGAAQPPGGAAAHTSNICTAHKLLHDAGLCSTAVQQWITGQAPEPVNVCEPPSPPPLGADTAPTTACERGGPLGNTAAAPPPKPPLLDEENSALDGGSTIASCCSSESHEIHESGSFEVAPHVQACTSRTAPVTSHELTADQSDSDNESRGGGCNVHALLHASPFSLPGCLSVADSGFEFEDSRQPLTRVDSGAPDISASQALGSPGMASISSQDSDPFLHEGPRESDIEPLESEAPGGTLAPLSPPFSVERAVSYDPEDIRAHVFTTFQNVPGPPARQLWQPPLPREAHPGNIRDRVPTGCDAPPPSATVRGCAVWNATFAVSDAMSGMCDASSASSNATGVAPAGVSATRGVAAAWHSTAPPLSTMHSGDGRERQRMVVGEGDTDAEVGDLQRQVFGGLLASCTGGGVLWSTSRSVSDNTLLPAPEHVREERDDVRALGRTLRGGTSLRKCMQQPGHRHRGHDGPAHGALRCVPTAPASALAGLIGRMQADWKRLDWDLASVPRLPLPQHNSRGHAARSGSVDRRANPCLRRSVPLSACLALGRSECVHDACGAC